MLEGMLIVIYKEIAPEKSGPKTTVTGHILIATCVSHS